MLTLYALNKGHTITPKVYFNISKSTLKRDISINFSKTNI